MVFFTLFLGFVIGAFVVIGIEVFGVWFLIQKLSKKGNEEDVKVSKSGVFGRDEQLQFSFPNKQGWVWILEKEKIPKTSPSTDKNLRQQKRKVDIVEVSPVKKHASIKDKSLIITETDGTHTNISLLGCIAEAVSATNLPSRKWAKKYPIKIESNSSIIYHGNKLFYMYFETSCEKESWCKALRLASCQDREKLIWFYKSRSEFHSYLASLNVEYPLFLKPSIGFNPEIGDRSLKIDGSASKVRHFLKKFKKTSKTGREDKKIIESSVSGSSKLSQTQKKPNYDSEEIIQTVTPRSTASGSTNQGSQSSDADSNDKIISDEGTLCCNLLISRLFFDAKSNVDLRKSIQARLQRTLSAIRTPSYVGEIICTDVNTGNLPPYIHGMRVLPSDLKEVVSMEIDIEYYGGAVLDIETRLGIQELENKENSDSKSVDDVTTDLLEGVEYYREQLKLKEQRTNQTVEQKGDEIRKLDETKSFKGNEQGSSTVSKWKSVLNSVAKQVSQVPLTLAIRVTTLRGTLRVHIKRPPSDQIWFGFTSMPDIDFSLESAVGDHKITSGHIAFFIINKFKVAIRETMVLPNSESVTIPFMLAEKNDWIPQNSAPFIWTNPETTTEPTTERAIIREIPCPQPSKETNALDSQEPQEPREVQTSSKRSTDSTHDKPTDSTDDEKLEANDEKTPLLKNEKKQPPQEVTVAPARQSAEENREVKLSSWQHLSPPPPPQAMMTVATTEESNETVEVDEARLTRMGTKAKMLGLRKKMGEKLEEKRRNIEEKGRHIVEKMRGPGGI